VPVALGRHRDGRSGGRIFGGVVDDLHEGLLDQQRIDIDEREIGVHVEVDLVPGEPSPTPFQRRVDDVGRLDPLHPRLDVLRLMRVASSRF